MKKKIFVTMLLLLFVLCCGAKNPIPAETLKDYPSANSYCIKGDKILDYYEKFYTPDNITTIIAGDINPDYVIAKIAKEFDFKGRKNHPKQEYKIDLQPTGGKYTEEYSKINTGFVMFGYLGAKANDIRTSLVLEMICSVLGDGLSSRLQQELIEKASEQIFNGVGAYYYPFRDGGNIFVQANFKPES